MSRNKEKPALTCEDHTPHPGQYIAHAEWAQKMMKTHKQIRCPQCRLYKIWIPKK